MWESLIHCWLAFIVLMCCWCVLIIVAGVIIDRLEPDDEPPSRRDRE